MKPVIYMRDGVWVCAGLKARVNPTGGRTHRNVVCWGMTVRDAYNHWSHQ